MKNMHVFSQQMFSSVQQMCVGKEVMDWWSILLFLCCRTLRLHFSVHNGRSRFSVCIRRKKILYEKWKLKRRSKNDLTEISTENIKNCAFFSICACHSCARRGYVNLRCIVCVFVCLCLFSVSIFFQIFRLDKRTR